MLDSGELHNSEICSDQIQVANHHNFDDVAIERNYVISWPKTRFANDAKHPNSRFINPKRSQIIHANENAVHFGRGFLPNYSFENVLVSRSGTSTKIYCISLSSSSDQPNILTILGICRPFMIYGDFGRNSQWLWPVLWPKPFESELFWLPSRFWVHLCCHADIWHQMNQLIC